MQVDHAEITCYHLVVGACGHTSHTTCCRFLAATSAALRRIQVLRCSSPTDRDFGPVKPLKGQSQTLTHDGSSKLDTLPVPAESPSRATLKQNNALLNEQSNYQKQILFHICSWACEKNKWATILHLRNVEEGLCSRERQLHSAVRKKASKGNCNIWLHNKMGKISSSFWTATKQNNLVKASGSWKKMKQINTTCTRCNY